MSTGNRLPSLERASTVREQNNEPVDPLIPERADLQIINNDPNLDNNLSDQFESATDSDISIDETMEGTMRIPPALNFEGNMKEKWTKWKQKFQHYLVASGLDSKSQERQVAVLLNVIGEEALEKYNTFGLSVEDNKNLQAVLTAFENYCSPKANETIDRHLFFSRQQQAGENFVNYLTELKTLSAPCGFGDLRDSLIKDRIIGGVRDSELKKNFYVKIT